jgi:hypothetical protein
VHVWIEDLPEYVDRQDPELAEQKLDVGANADVVQLISYRNEKGGAVHVSN